MVTPFPPFPKGLDTQYYKDGYNYFKSFNGFGDDYEIVSSEHEFSIVVEGYNFKGIIDLVLRNKKTGGLVIVDHKSKKYQGLINELSFYRRQLYAYAIYVKEKYGVFPEELWFNVFREQKVIKEIFDEGEYNDTVRWLVDTIEDIIQRDMFEDDWSKMENYPSYFCKFICGVRNQCLMDDY